MSVLVMRIILRFALTTYIVRMASDSIHTPQEVIDTVDNIPSVDQCWLQCISVLRSFADGSLWMGEEVRYSKLLHIQIAEFAVDRLQRCILRQGDGVPSGVALLKCFDTIMLGLLIHYGRNDREKSYIVGIFVSTLLASSDTLSKQPGFSSYWLRVIDALCKYATQGGSLSETTIERMKNMLLVMRFMIGKGLMCSVEGRFEVMSEVAGQNIMEATMTMLDSYCPSIRTDLEGTFKESERSMEKTPEPKEKVEEGVTEVSKEEAKEQLTEVPIIEATEQSTEVSTMEITEQPTETPLEECVKDTSEPVATEVVVEQKVDSVPENLTEEPAEQSNEPSIQEDDLVHIIPDEDPQVQ